MNTSTDIDATVDHCARRILARSPADAWAACAAIWVRLWVVAGPGWERWPLARQHVFEALSAALSLSVGAPTATSSELTRMRLEGLEIDDDGTPECWYIVDLVEDLLAVLGKESVEVCLKVTLRTFLEGRFNEMANRVAETLGGAISQAEAKVRLADDTAWQQTVRFVQSL